MYISVYRQLINMATHQKATHQRQLNKIFFICQYFHTEVVKV